MSLRLKKFDLQKIGFLHGSSIVIIGKDKTSKTRLVNNILDEKKIPTGIVISSTPGKIKSKHSKIIEFDTNSLSNININSLHSKMFIVFKDLINDKYNSINELCVNNINIYKSLLIFSIELSKTLPYVIRSTTDYIFIFKNNMKSMRSMKRIYDDWIYMFPDFKIFYSIFDICIEKNECLVIDNTVKSRKIEDMLFWYKIEI